MPSSISSVDELGISGFLHAPSEPSGNGLVLTHGAGANCQAPLLVALAKEFCDHGFIVLRYELQLRKLRSHGPPRPGFAELDRETIRTALQFLRGKVNGRLFAGGHSYGGRQTTMLLAEEPHLADGLLLLSYPLHPPKKPTQLRTTHFPKLRTPSLFVHGTRDGFGTIAEITEALKLIPAPNELMPVEGAGHELLSKKNAETLPQQIVEAFSTKFLSSPSAI